MITINKNILCRPQLIVDLIIQNGYKNIAEVGVLHGWNAENILKHLKMKDYQLDKFYLIDNEIHKGLRKFEQPEVEFLHMTSKKAAGLIDDKSLDLVYIDADHGYESVMEDIRLWMPKVRPGGIISGHDYDGHHSDVQRAVKESFKSFNVRMAANNLSSWWKKI